MSPSSLLSSIVGTNAPQATTATSRDRVVWCDIAKAIAIIMVVEFHATNEVLHDVTFDDWWHRMATLPLMYFRMPLFFFASGIFAAISVQRNWLQLTERTLLHLAYVLIVWNLIEFVPRWLFPGVFNFPFEHPLAVFALLLFEPLGVTWFIEVLLIYYIALRLFRNVPPILLVAVGAVLAILPAADPWEYWMFERMQSLFVFFALGYALSMPMRNSTWRPPAWLVAVLVAGFLVLSSAYVGYGLDHYRSLGFVLSIVGVLAAAIASIWISHRQHIGWLIYIGGRTLPIFVMHIFVIKVVRELLTRPQLIENPAVLIALTTIAGVIVPLLFYQLCMAIEFPWLFERPRFLRLKMPVKPVSGVPD